MSVFNSTMNFKETMEFTELLWKAKTKLRPCYLGHTGVGKTELAKQLADKHNMDLIIIHVSQLEPSDFVGLYQINDEGRTSNCPPSWLPYREYKGEGRVVELDKEKNPDATLADVLVPRDQGYINPNGGIVFLDEFNRGHEDIRQSMYQLIQDKRIHTLSLPDNYQIITAANPPSEGYETYEFDPAMINRLAWIQFRPDFDETQKYLEDKYGRNLVLSWAQSNKDLVDFGETFKIEGLLYSPRNMEEHIKIFNAAKNVNRKFVRKMLCTVMQEEKVQSFMSFLEEAEFVNYADVISGLKGEKAKKAQQLIDEQRVGILSTIALDLADFFSKYEFGKTDHKLIKDEKQAVKNVTDFLVTIPDEILTTFIDALGSSYTEPTSYIRQDYAFKTLKAKLKKYSHLFK